MEPWMGFPSGPAVKDLPVMGDIGLILRLEDPLEEWHLTPKFLPEASCNDMGPFLRTLTFKYPILTEGILPEFQKRRALRLILVIISAWLSQHSV